jgi:hypothetical protein
MKILFEGHKYSTQAASKLLPSDYFDGNSEQPKPRVVGYHYSDEFNCPVIILPKVFLDENDCFFLDGINPEIFLEDDYLTSILNPDLRKQVANFLFECSSWFYFSIKKYFYKYKETLSLFEDNLNIIDCSHSENFHTELDLIFSLLKFNKENKDLFLFIKKINKSQNNKIDWNRTIKKTNPVIDSSGSPIYLETLSKKKQINVDEDLLVLFFSLLKYIERKYNIKIPINPYYNLHSQKEFNKIKQRGTYYLRSIRYKYFDDRLLTLYRLLYSYFEKSEESTTKVKRKEYLIIKDYNLVFQDMVDELLSDTDIPRKLKTHKDGKELDHIYKSKSFFEDDGIYFIGDSKYYKRGNPIEEKSIYKQFTYAKNVIQYNIDLFNEDGSYPNGIRYRDELSEGYNITPNFFIRGLVDHLNHSQPELTLDGNQDFDNQINLHFSDRLFDRDTLIVQSYSINFLYVLWSYISSNTTDGNQFKVEAKRTFRESLVAFIEENYNFSLVTTTDSVSDFIKENFYKLNGRIYRPANFAESNNFIIALREGQDIANYLDLNTKGEISINDYSID